MYFYKNTKLYFTCFIITSLKDFNKLKSASQEYFENDSVVPEKMKIWKFKVMDNDTENDLSKWWANFDQKSLHEVWAQMSYLIITRLLQKIKWKEQKELILN